METAALKPTILETKPEQFIKGRECLVRLGHLAIKSDQLGINDPLTYLYKYIEHGSPSLVGIQADIETDIAERLPKTPFINTVDFRFTGSDFVSVVDRVSMRSMTQTNLDIFQTEATKNTNLAEECTRARAEAEEVEKLTAWFESAPIGAYQIFESLPISDQEFAVSRIYQKVNSTSLSGIFVSLYSASVERFTQLRRCLSPNAPTTGSTAIDVLRANYGFFDPELSDRDKFINHYVGIYDSLLTSETGFTHSFGVKADTIENGIVKVRKQSKLTKVYVDIIKSIADGKGLVTAELAAINSSLGSDYRLNRGDNLSIELIRGILSDTLLRIASVIDRADISLLKDLENYQTGTEANLAAMSHFGSQARSEGASYSSGGCPTVSRSEESNSTDREVVLLGGAFNLFGTPDSFGCPKIGVCRVPNCPTRGEVSWRDERTLVGGCDICVSCHKLFEKGKSPAKVYAEQQKKAAEERRHEEEIRRVHKKAAQSLPLNYTISTACAEMR